MLATTAHNLVQNFDKTCDSVIQNCEPIIITRSNDNNVVLISQAEYDNLIKNFYSQKEKTNKLSVLYEEEEINNSLLSESSLSKDWLREEENAAWQDL